MFNRRDALKAGMAAAGAGFAASQVKAAPQHGQRPFPQSGLVFPQTHYPSVVARPSPKVTPFVAPLNIMPVAQPVPQSDLLKPENGGVAPDPDRHQRFNEFPPQKFYIEHLTEMRWRYHPEAPYGDGGTGYSTTAGSWSYGFNNLVPGATYKAWYGEPIFLRRLNKMPPIGSPDTKVNFALPSLTIHLHNAHTASESDGIPQDYFDPGEFWDHHYGNFPAGFDDREKMNTLWYHDHRLDFTSPNVYAGLTGFYWLFDEFDSDNENDPNPAASRLPSGEYDIPLILHDVQFQEDGQVAWDFFTPDIQELDGHHLPSFMHTTFGMLGDQFTVNRTIQPYLDVKRRKYRFRILNGGPSRLYDLYLRSDSDDPNAKLGEKFITISEDGNLHEEPIESDNVEVWVANRRDVIVDFSHFNAGDNVYLVNRKEMRDTGEGPTGRLLDEGNLIMQFRVQADEVEDPSRIPDVMRKQPDIDFREVRRERLFTFDYDNGLFTIDGRLMDPNRVDAAMEQGTAEIWTFRNEGNAWGHPIHTHMEEFQVFEINGKPVPPNSQLDTKKDVVQLGPGDEFRFFSRWRDFLGKHVMHCHNVVHEDHAMMIRWDIVEPGQGD
ncbi:multicopper oxidase family protein [Ferruginivarius sediminum]|uniref:Multicopper oxidase CueO n=1 Tax=Ferruginivarius sediminum TaxID=2661937 RepID=A0A369TCP8_9PROT|nr:multicopper oxidase domain-containing protein [Ferruginivarius sediminum]RDD63058.1 copper oxidase [Ferruginivarius sediminum]